jgi:gamma-tubulin complex component 5
LALDVDSDDEVGNQSDVASDPAREQDRSLFGLVGEQTPYKQPPHTYAHRREFEALQEKQYWREEWKGDGFVEKRVFSMGDASTLGRLLLQPPIFARAF